MGMKGRKLKRVLEVPVGMGSVHEGARPSQVAQTSEEVRLCLWLGRNPSDQSPSGTLRQTLERALTSSQHCQKV